MRHRIARALHRLADRISPQGVVTCVIYEDGFVVEDAGHPQRLEYLRVRDERPPWTVAQKEALVRDLAMLDAYERTERAMMFKRETTYGESPAAEVRVPTLEGEALPSDVGVICECGGRIDTAGAQRRTTPTGVRWVGVACAGDCGHTYTIEANRDAATPGRA